VSLSDRSGDRAAPPGLVAEREGFKTSLPVAKEPVSVAEGELPERSKGAVSKSVPSCGGPRVRIPLPPAASPSLAGLYLRGSRTPLSARVCSAVFPVRATESRRARQHRTKLGQYLCRAIFQYRIFGDVFATSWWAKVATWCPNEVGLPLGSEMLVDLASSDRTKQSRARSADRASLAADVRARAASAPSDRAAGALRESLG
jgi:hypothetical protein